LVHHSPPNYEGGKRRKGEKKKKEGKERGEFLLYFVRVLCRAIMGSGQQGEEGEGKKEFTYFLFHFPSSTTQPTARIPTQIRGKGKGKGGKKK